MEVYLVDGTYELFRQHFGQPPRQAPDGREIAATRGVVSTLLGLLESGVTHVGVATDHVVESFRNDLWAGYKTSAGMPPELLAQFPLVEEAVAALGVTVWAMVELEADDALASAASVAEAHPDVTQVRICTPDKDLAQCVRERRVVQFDRRHDTVFDESGVWEKFGVAPRSIPDWLALVGDSADGFPGLAGWGKRSASVVLAHYGSIDAVPDKVADWDKEVRTQVRNAAGLAARLAEERELALLFRTLATLRVEPTLVPDVDALAWRGHGPGFGDICAQLGDTRLVDRAERLAAKLSG
ncbi:MAG TPA: 5'-3' exonuclease H3TH domain-containing protein [Acidimicrobiales bacterium]|nr:5'-3' exonuclease H3TH domain-containing protein [Acidimicrobiales bacterium]